MYLYRMSFDHKGQNIHITTHCNSTFESILLIFKVFGGLLSISFTQEKYNQATD